MKKLLVIIDMVNGFINEGPMADNYINHITNNIVELVKQFIENKYDIISFQEGHSQNSKEFESFPRHCILGTNEAELVLELQPYRRDIKVIRKNSTCGFVTEEFMKYLRNNQNDLSEIVIVGCCTDICVLNFAIPLKNYINEYDLDIKININKDSVETYNSPMHNREQYNNMSFKIMQQNGIIIE